MKTKLTNYSIAKILREKNNLELNPFFQRGRVWSESRRQMFIDTILKNWGVPKIYLAIIKASDSKTIRLCVDGQQRVRTIIDYLENRFPLDGKISKEFGAKKYENLSEKTREFLNNYKISVEELSEFQNNDLTELFRRLQLGVNLNLGENLNAIEGEMTNFAKNIARNTFFKKKITILDTRNSFLSLACQICLLEILGIQSVKSKDLKNFLNTYKAFNKNSAEAKKIVEVFRFLEKIFSQDKASELKSKANIVSVYVLISNMMTRGNLTGKEAQFRRFFKFFFEELQIEISKKSTKKPEYLKYQTALLSSPDSQKSIKDRNDIILNKLANYNKFFKSLVNINLEEDEFRKLYDKFETKHGLKTFENLLKKTSPKVRGLKCAGNRGSFETLPTHVRNSIHHAKHPRYTKKQLEYSLNLLKKIKL
jgi:hypothetical protein